MRQVYFMIAGCLITADRSGCKNYQDGFAVGEKDLDKVLWIAKEWSIVRIDLSSNLI